MLAVECVPVGRLSSNSYIVFDSESLDGIIIDAGGEAEKILKIVKSNEVKIRGIYLTHGHFDHVLAVRDLREGLGCGFYMHKADQRVLARVPRDAKYFLGIDIDPPPKPDGWVRDGEAFRIGKYLVRVIHAPGHTPGSVCYVIRENVFVGDTLFAGSIGRTDLPGGNLDELASSLKDKILKLPDHYVIYPGHGPSSMIGVERRLNPFVRSLMNRGDGAGWRI